LLKHFKHNKYFSDRQFGFLKGRSTVTQLLSMLDDWTQLLESGGRIDVIYTDLEKAFDKVLYHRLISKLYSHQVNKEIILWIVFSYVENKGLRLMMSCDSGLMFSVASLRVQYLGLFCSLFASMI